VSYNSYKIPHCLVERLKFFNCDKEELNLYQIRPFAIYLSLNVEEAEKPCVIKIEAEALWVSVS